MQVTETKSDGLKREYSVVMPASELETKIGEKLEAVRADFQMKGFRKGKAPAPLLKKMFGKSMLSEAVQETVDDALRGHFETTGHRPAQQPDVRIANENYAEGDDLTVAISYEQLPEIPETDFAKIKIQRLAVEIESSAVDEALAKLAETATNYQRRRKNSKARDGDQIVIDFNGAIDGDPFDGGAAEDYPLVLGSNSFIPGFEEQLVGVSADDEVSVNVDFPQDYGAENLAGKAAVFACKVKEIRAPKPSEVDDELAKKFGAESLDALKTQISERLAEECKEASRAHAKRQLLDSLDGIVSFELPVTLVEAEAQQISHQLWHDENPDVQGHDHPEIEVTDEARKLAERRVRLGLLLAETGSRNSISVSDADLNAAIMRQASQYPGQERAFYGWVRGNQGAMQQIRAPLFEDKVVDFVMELAKVTEKKVTKDELENALKAFDDEA